ncbi:MAG TPA: hypoxanthine phosphoribosyltransferase [Chloroflexota bacterium]|nr:hypoxanthine phosphoribosyltransferase [Chloroflexota bacterium]
MSMRPKPRHRRAARLHPDIATVVVPPAALARRVRELGAQITAECAGQELVLLGVLKGAMVFLADLARAIQLPLTVEFVSAASYGRGTQSSGVVHLRREGELPVRGRHVLVVDTILDTGLTLRALDAALREQQPASVRYCVLLCKDRGGPPPFPVDYIGFTIPDQFVVGYGLDYAERYRNLPYVGVLRASAYVVAPAAAGTEEPSALPR